MERTVTLDQIADRLLAAAPPGSRVILFGSRARDSAGRGSDVDFLVVERDVADCVAEAVRLRAALRPSTIPIDVIVANEATFEYWRDTPNTIYHEAARDGRVYGEGIAPPRHAQTLPGLTPFVVQMRYPDAPAPSRLPGNLTALSLCEQVADTIEWATRSVRLRSTSDSPLSEDPPGTVNGGQ